MKHTIKSLVPSKVFQCGDIASMEFGGYGADEDSLYIQANLSLNDDYTEWEVYVRGSYFDAKPNARLAKVGIDSLTPLNVRVDHAAQFESRRQAAEWMMTMLADVDRKVTAATKRRAPLVKIIAEEKARWADEHPGCVLHLGQVCSCAFCAPSASEASDV